MYIICLLLFYLKVENVFSFTNYEIFQGFDVDRNLHTTDTINETTIASQNETKLKSDLFFNTNFNVTTTEIPKAYIVPLNNTGKLKKKKDYKNSTCFEERPSNIGSYEVPTQKDIVLFTKDLLINLFEVYKRDAMSLLRDMKEITKATKSIETKCKYNKTAYKQCVKLASGKSEIITKSLVTSLEMKTIDIQDLTENTICTLSEMEKDPISLVKLIVQETTMLKFALPGFLRLLNSCSVHCDKSQRTVNTKKPLRRVTDQDLVVKYFLTKNNNIQLIKDSRRAV